MGRRFFLLQNTKILYVQMVLYMYKNKNKNTPPLENVIFFCIIYEGHEVGCNKL